MKTLLWLYTAVSYADLKFLIHRQRADGITFKSLILTHVLRHQNPRIHQAVRVHRITAAAWYPHHEPLPGIGAGDGDLGKVLP